MALSHPRGGVVAQVVQGDHRSGRLSSSHQSDSYEDISEAVKPDTPKYIYYCLKKYISVFAFKMLLNSVKIVSLSTAHKDK